MLEAFFVRMACQSYIEIDETFDLLTLSATEQTDFSLLSKLFEELKTISPRDKFELIIEIGGNTTAISGCHITDKVNLESHIEKYSDNEDYEFTLTINKLVDRKTCSIYFLGKFSIFIEKQSIYSLFSSFSARIDGIIHFEVFSTIETFGSQSIVFFDSSDGLERQIDIDTITIRDEKLEEILNNSSLTNSPKNLVPEDFLLKSPSTFFGIDDCFSRLNSVLSLIFIASASEIDKDGTFSYKIFGYKCLSSDNVDINALAMHQPNLYLIYDWAFSGGSRSDKLGLIRNILTIHLNDNGDPLFDSDVLDAIKSSYQIYLKDNVNSYLETKNKIGEIIIESIAKTAAMADELAQSFKSNKNEGQTGIKP